MTLNMMLIEMPVAKAEDFYQHVQVQMRFACILLATQADLWICCKHTMYAVPDPAYYNV